METFYAFHLVTNNPMKVAQIIDLTEGQHNTLYRFFLEKEVRNEQQQDVFNVIAGKSTLNEEETAMVKHYLGSSIRAIREQITEFVRIQHFPHYRHAFHVYMQRKQSSKQCNGSLCLNHIIAKYYNL